MSNYESYQPKGGMCLNCKDATRDCSHLPFHVMPVIRNVGPVAIVKCAGFKQNKDTK